jgi:ectoine hydroxylase-related dioxygenase (phytanoyl-CoA dioxygenase family)
MPWRLSSDEIGRFHENGIVFPVPVFDAEEIGERYAALQAIEGACAGRLPPLLNFKPHLLVPWLWDMIHDPRILDTVEDLLGPDILCWGSSFFNKQPDDPSHVGWHQDATYWGLSSNEGLTAWVAFTPSVRANGCMRVVPGSHREVVPHGDTHDRTSMLPGREKVMVGVKESRAVDVVLAPGEMSLHDRLIVHGSEPNRSGDRRVGFAIRYIPGELRQRGDGRGTAALVRGRDHGTFDLEQRPEAELGAAARARHPDLLRRWTKIVSAEMKKGNDAPL